MIKIENVTIEGFEPAIRGMRNPMNSWEKSDSVFYDQWSGEYHDICGNSGPYDSNRISVDYEIGPNDIDLMQRLAKAGPEHAKYRRMIVVWLDITAPLYWWKEFDTYKVGTVSNSCSTMHKIADKEFELRDFSPEHLRSFANNPELKDAISYWIEPNKLPVTEITDTVVMLGDGSVVLSPTGALETTIKLLNQCRFMYKNEKDQVKKKAYWWQLIQLLPSSYNQKRTIMLNYEVLYNMYYQRKDHKLDEWLAFCDWIKTLPYAKEVITCD